MKDFIQAPPEGAVQTMTDKVNALRVKFTPMKTPESYVGMVTDKFITDQVKACKLGFSYYSKDQGGNQFLQPFTFALLEVYSGMGGLHEVAKGEYVQYWSNRVKDTRIEEIVLFSSVGKGPVAKGLYHDIKAMKDHNGQSVVPSSVNYQMFALAYCIELGKAVEINISGRVSSAIQDAVAVAESAQGRKISAKRVNMFSLADTENVWGFRLVGYEKQNKEGDKYKSGELYFAPVFQCGVISKEAPFYIEALEIQQQAREFYASGVERRLAKAYAEHESQKDQNAPRTEFPAAPRVFNTPKESHTPFQGSSIENLTSGSADEFVPANATDDLPF